ncbi:MAG TPA: dihydrodipicolinate reductase [Caldilineae bacterium]|nr:dihydrodipicolinate reductase [Caldilineae bacterium]
MADPIRVVQYGLGPIGSAIARHVVERRGLTLVGAVDIDPQKVGRDAGEVIGLERPLGFPIRARLSEVLAETSADVAVHSTSSYFKLFKPQITEILEAGLDVVSTAEELSFPWIAHPTEAEEIDAVARRCGKTVLGTGVNPGFLMDTLPITLTAICQSVDHIAVTRVVDASKRRGPFQLKIGAGMTPEAFQEKMATGRMGHVGLRESMDHIADTLGRRLVHYEEHMEPVLAEHPIYTPYVEVKPGQVRGLKQIGRGYTESGEFIVLTFIAALEAGDEQDIILIEGKPDLEVVLRGTNGDLATVAMAVNVIPRVVTAPPGLVTMRDLPPVHYW